LAALKSLLEDAEDNLEQEYNTFYLKLLYLLINSGALFNFLTERCDVGGKKGNVTVTNPVPCTGGVG
jgi:hypothetical protein